MFCHQYAYNTMLWWVCIGWCRCHCMQCTHQTKRIANGQQILNSQWIEPTMKRRNATLRICRSQLSMSMCIETKKWCWYWCYRQRRFICIYMFYCFTVFHFFHRVFLFLLFFFLLICFCFIIQWMRCGFLFGSQSETEQPTWKSNVTTHSIVWQYRHNISNTYSLFGFWSVYMWVHTSIVLNIWKEFTKYLKASEINLDSKKFYLQPIGF